MAVDELLLESAAVEGVASLRFYRWAEPTISLGYFQDMADRSRHPASRDCPVVRRATGGGAIVHDRELTYSIALPAGHRLAEGRLELYRAVHRVILEIYADLGFDLSLYPGQMEDDRRASFLCFERRAPGDIVTRANGTVSYKVTGSAQRRHQGAVLQHGSILLDRSEAAPELPGLNDLAGRELIDMQGLARELIDRLAAEFEIEFEPLELTETQKSRVSSWVRAKYANDDWTVRRVKKWQV
jgi:lipoate-protein ligase A